MFKVICIPISRIKTLFYGNNMANILSISFHWFWLSEDANNMPRSNLNQKKLNPNIEQMLNDQIYSLKRNDNQICSQNPRVYIGRKAGVLISQSASYYSRFMLIFSGQLYNCQEKAQLSVFVFTSSMLIVIKGELYPTSICDQPKGGRRLVIPLHTTSSDVTPRAHSLSADF